MPGRARSRGPLSRLAPCLPAVLALGAMLPAPAPAQDLPRVRPAPSRPPSGASQGIPWQHDLEAAIATARGQGRPMMIEFWADWCGPCHMLEQRTFSAPEVIRAARRFVTVRIDFDRNPQLARRFEVFALPAVLFTDAYGTEIVRLDGFVEARQFLTLMGKVPADISPFNILSRRLLENEADYDALLDLGLLFRRHALLRNSTWYLQQAVRTGNALAPPPPRQEEALFYLGENHLQRQEWAAALAAFGALLEKFPAGGRVPIAHLEMAKAYLALGEADRARPHLEPLLAAGTDERLAREARELLGLAAAAGQAR